MDKKKWLLKHPCIEPPCGWEYDEERTGLTIKQPDIHQLVDKIIKHRTHRKLLPVNPNIVLIEVHEQICKKLEYDEAFCKVDRNG